MLNRPCPLRQILAGNLDVCLQLQVYTGYAETLRAYDQRHDFIRIGLPCAVKTHEEIPTHRFRAVLPI